MAPESGPEWNRNGASPVEPGGSGEKKQEELKEVTKGRCLQHCLNT